MTSNLPPQETQRVLEMATQTANFGKSPTSESYRKGAPLPAVSEDQDSQDREAFPVGAGSAPVYSVFSRRQKQWIVFMVAIGSVFSPFSSSCYFPALNTLASTFQVSNTQINLTLTTFMIFQGFSPTLFSELGTIFGRRPIYFLSFIIYLAANIGLALQNNYYALLLLRCLQSAGSSGTVALAFGVVGDLATSAERGSYVGFVSAGLMIGPAFGPVIGGLLAQFLGWRSIFWFLTILSAAYLSLYGFTCPETGRNFVGNGSIPPLFWNMSVMDYMSARKSLKSDPDLVKQQNILASKRQLRWPNILSTLGIVREKDAALLLVYNALCFAAFYDVTACLPSLFKRIYGFNDLQIGLCYVPMGVGAAFGSVIAGRALDHNYKRIAKSMNLTVDCKRGDDIRAFPIEVARIQLTWPFLVLTIISTRCYGWLVEFEGALPGPLVLLFLIGLSLTAATNMLNTLLMDMFPNKGSTVMAANNLFRCWLGAGATAIIDMMITVMGVGACFSLIAGLILLGSPILLVILDYGPRWREERTMNADADAKIATEAKANDILEAKK